MFTSQIIDRMRANTDHYCERYKKNDIPVCAGGNDNGHLAIVASPDRESVRPRGSDAFKTMITEENTWFYRLIHRNIRNGRRSPRPARKPRYKDVRVTRPW